MLCLAPFVHCCNTIHSLFNRNPATLCWQSCLSRVGAALYCPNGRFKQTSPVLSPFLSSMSSGILSSTSAPSKGYLPASITQAFPAQMTVTQFLLAAIVFLHMVIAEDPVVDWTPYEPTFGIFGNFWDNANPRIQFSSKPGATCEEVFGNKARWVISACQSLPDGQYVRSGCFYNAQTGPTATGIYYMIAQTPCPNGMTKCGNYQSHTHWGTGTGSKYPQMHAQCSY